MDQTIWEKEKISRTSDGQYNKGLSTLRKLEMSQQTTQQIGKMKKFLETSEGQDKNRSPAGPFPCEPMTELPRVKPKKLEMEMKASLMKLTQTAHLYTKLDNMKN